jgi:hypothetical protein
MLQSHRVKILQGEFSLSLNPALILDSGEYHCVVNGGLRGKPVNLRVQGTVKPLFTYSIGQKWLYLLRKVLKLRYGFP